MTMYLIFLAVLFSSGISQVFSKSSEDEDSFPISFKWKHTDQPDEFAFHKGDDPKEVVLRACEARPYDCNTKFVAAFVKAAKKEMLKRNWNVGETPRVLLKQFEDDWENVSSSKNCESVDRVDAKSLSSEVFLRNYVMKSKPLIITGAFRSEALKTTYSEWLHFFGDAQLQVHISEQGNYDHVEDAEIWDAFDDFYNSDLRKFLENCTSRFNPHLIYTKPAITVMTFSKFMKFVLKQRLAQQRGEQSPVYYLEYLPLLDMPFWSEVRTIIHYQVSNTHISPPIYLSVRPKSRSRPGFEYDWLR